MCSGPCAQATDSIVIYGEATLYHQTRGTVLGAYLRRSG